MIDLRFSQVELEATREHITSFIANIIASAGADGAVLGLSGGVDSSLTAHLAVEAIGADRLYGLILPAAVSSDEHMGDAEFVAHSLRIDYDIIEVEPLVEHFIEAVPEAGGDELAVGNTRARVRGVINYLVANHENRVVLGTGNRSEALVGYFTKYGDGAVDCNPIGNLYKGHVRQLATHVGVPERIVEKSPTAELWTGQTDEDELGIDYDTLDNVLALHIDGPLSADATMRVLDCERAVIERVHQLSERSEHKRSPPPTPDRDVPFNQQ